MSPILPLPPELSAQTPASVLSMLDQLRAENERLQMENARLETLVAKFCPTAAGGVESFSSISHSKKRKSRKRRKLILLTGVIVLLVLALGGGALVAYLISATFSFLN